MTIYISEKVQEKLENKHGGISPDEIDQCFANRPENAKFLKDRREQHRTDPPTLWFISETDRGIKYKIVFVLDAQNDIYLKSAFIPNAEEIRIYEKYGIRS